MLNLKRGFKIRLANGNAATVMRLSGEVARSFIRWQTSVLRPCITRGEGALIALQLERVIVKTDVAGEEVYLIYKRSVPCVWLVASLQRPKDFAEALSDVGFAVYRGRIYPASAGGNESTVFKAIVTALLDNTPISIAQLLV